MPNDKGHIRYEAGTVGGITVTVIEHLPSRPGQYQVELLDTYCGTSEIGEPFIGKGALRRASVFSESILSALECADITWSR